MNEFLIKANAGLKKNHFSVLVYEIVVFALSATPTTPAHTVQLGRCK